MTAKEQLSLASDLYARGLTPIPLLPNGQKHPAVKWATMKVNRPTEREVLNWFAQGLRGFSMLGGAASGGLEAFDFDNHKTTGDEFRRWWQALPETMTSRLILIRTPSNGWRVPWLFKDDSDWDGRVLARRDREEASIEYHRARLLHWPGGCADCHPTGKPYVWFRGSSDRIPTLTPNERQQAIQAAKDLSAWECPPVPEKPPHAIRGTKADNERRDWNTTDDYANRTTWEEILEPHDWTWYTGDCWTRPGRSAAVSATVNYQNSDMLYVFSSSTSFLPNKGYQKWAAYAVLNHTDRKSGSTDFGGALKELARRGYGRANRLNNMANQVTSLFANNKKEIYDL